MKIETERILIREIQENDSIAFTKMVADGSLSDIWEDYNNCEQWMPGFI